MFLIGAVDYRGRALGTLMNGFAKIFASMLRSTVWVGQPLHVKVAWVTLLCLADAEGNVWASVPGLAHDAGVTLEQCTEALQLFLSADPHSRTTQHGGRRIVEIDGGWHIYNHRKYREIQSTKQQSDAKRSRRYRARKASAGGFAPVDDERRSVTGDVTSVTHHASHVMGRPRDPERPISLQPAETIAPSVTHHENHIRHAPPASVYPDQSLATGAIPDQIPSFLDSAKDGRAREATRVTGNAGVFDAPVFAPAATMTVEVPAGWQPKSWHLEECRIAKLDSELEAKRFRTTHFQKPFPATEAGIDKRFSNWLVEAKNRVDEKQFAAGGGVVATMPKRPHVPGLPAWVHPDHAAFARDHGLRLRTEVAEFAKGFHLPVDSLRPIDVYEPFRDHLARRAEQAPRTVNQ